MHQSSLENMQRCYERYIKTRNWDGRDKIDVIDIGGANVNGSYADIFSGSEFVYRSADINPDANVDLILYDPYKLPLADSSIDIIISGQAFEHVEFFWLLFEEMVRVLKPDGIIILIAPSSGPIHRYSVDCYRFYPDAYHALAKYCHCEVIDVMHDQRGPWNDLVGVFSKERLSFSEDGVPGRVWEANRYEKLTCPVDTSIRHANPNVEKVAGEEHYIKIMARIHNEICPDHYLEIGIRKGNSLSLARRESIAIDPEAEIDSDLLGRHQVFVETSDRFFELHAGEVIGKNKIDLAFIDGMHLFEYALRDFINVERFSAPHAVVVIDDVNPNHSIQAHRIRKSAVWMGDIWKLAYCLSEFRKDLQLTYLDTSPSGLLIVTGLKANNKVLMENYNPIVRKYKDMELDGDYHREVIHRTRSISPTDQRFWDAIKAFVKEVKMAAPHEKHKIIARQNRVLSKIRMHKPKISIVVIAYNMSRELPRTIFTLRAPYQIGLQNDDIDIIVVDNGSTEEAIIDADWHNVRYFRYHDVSPSPVKAINFGLKQAKAHLVGVMIDGARMASPSMLYFSLLAGKLGPRVIVTTMAYHLGPDVQMKSIPSGYNQQIEDKLLDSVPWQADGYCLFDISVLAGSSANGWFNPIAETNALFLSREMWDELGGYDENFLTPGGGLVNLDTYLRALELRDSLHVKLMGEGTFHQVHGGIATNQQREDASWKVFSDEYVRLRNKPFRRSDKKAIQLGMVKQQHKRFIELSLKKI